MEFVEIDGALGEGGGSILRLSSAFSVLYKRAVRIINIRANRAKPGLRLQHLLSLQALAELTNSELSDCRIGSSEISFFPGSFAAGNKISVSIQTAASIGLLLQSIQIAALGLNSKEISIDLEGGGTYGKWAPSPNYLNRVTYPVFERAGLKVSLDAGREGFYPRGGARAQCRIYPSQSRPEGINITELGTVSEIRVNLVVSMDLRGRGIPERVAGSFRSKIEEAGLMGAEISHQYVDSLSTGVGMEAWAESETGAIISSGTIIGERHVTSEKLGKMAAEKIARYIQNDIPVDNYLSDQLIPLMAFIRRPSRIKVLKVTGHAETNLELLRRFTDRNYYIQELDKGFLIEYL
ncbi:MAG: RNA 3'-phosphate cyclase, partial [Candidatus Latescibacteria bacterium]|nr:RNA 3'-phosphate cyclase [bacterium]MBD3424964.1 RNA 3'-phosphate cyclase [Candidatus Latescibacterota bacterium]